MSILESVSAVAKPICTWTTKSSPSLEMVEWSSCCTTNTRSCAQVLHQMDYLHGMHMEGDACTHCQLSALVAGPQCLVLLQDFYRNLPRRCS